MGAQERVPRQLPPGRHGLPREYVAHNQRERILDAVIEVVAEVGYAELTVEAVVNRAGTSRRTFYQHFTNKEAVFLAAYDACAARMVEQIEQAQDQEDFCQQVESILQRALSFLAAHPAQAYLLVVEVLAVSSKAIEKRNAAITIVIEMLHRTTCELADEEGKEPPPMITAETVIGGVAEVIYNRVQRGETSRLPQLLPDLLYCALLPYVGPERAAAEHGRVTARAH